VTEAELELANVRRLCERAGVAPADGNGELRSTVRMVEELVASRVPATPVGFPTPWDRGRIDPARH
jgi:hypothetical protein